MYDDDNTSYEKSQYYAGLGWHIFPIYTINEDGKCTCYKPDCSDPGKHPASPKGFKDATIDDATLQKFFYNRDNMRGIGLATGTVSGVWTLDVDDKTASGGEDADTNLKRLEDQYGQLPETVCFRSGGGGYQFFFAMPIDGNGIPTDSERFLPGIDQRGDGGYSILPPSKHKTGNRYQWIVSPDSTPIAHAPDWLVELARGNPTVELAKNRDAPHKAIGVAGQPTAHGRTFIAESSTVERVRRYADTVPNAIVGQHAKDACWRLGKDLFKAIPNLTVDHAMDGLQDWLSRGEGPLTERDLRYQLKRACDDVEDAGELAIENVEHEDDETEVSQPPTSHEKHSPVPPNLDPWPTLHDCAYHGFAGEFIRYVEPHTEADPVAMLITTLLQFGNAIGRNAYFMVSGDRQTTNIFSVIIGKSSRARKGTSASCVRMLFSGIDTGQRFDNGISTGEGLINALADKEPESQSTITVPDKRALVFEGEFARLLGVMKRTENTASSIVRNAFDSDTLSVLTRNNPLRATGCHISILGHITEAELKDKLTETDCFNGFGNRFLWIKSKRSKFLPDAGALPNLDDFRTRLRAIIECAMRVQAMHRTEAAQHLWRNVFLSLCEERTGTWDAVTSRAETQVIRLSMIYALLDGSEAIDVPHLQAALAVWQYADESAWDLFGEFNPLEDEILDCVRLHPSIMRSELCKYLPRRIGRKQVEQAIQQLEQTGVLRRETTKENRHNVERFFPTDRSNAPMERNPFGLPATSKHETVSSEPIPIRYDSDSQAIMDNIGSHVPSASYTDLLDWKNTHGASVVKREDGCIWLTKEHLLDKSLEGAIKDNQELLRMLLPSEPETPPENNESNNEKNLEIDYQDDLEASIAKSIEVYELGIKEGWCNE